MPPKTKITNLHLYELNNNTPNSNYNKKVINYQKKNIKSLNNNITPHKLNII